MRSDEPLHHPIPVLRIAILALVILISLWIFQAIQPFLGGEEQGQSFKNPFAENITPPPPDRIEISVELENALRLLAQNPGGFVAAVRSVQGQVVSLNIYQLPPENRPVVEKQTDTTLALAYLVVSVYDGTQRIPPDRLELYFDPAIPDLPTYSLIIVYEDALAYYRNELTEAEFIRQWH